MSKIRILTNRSSETRVYDSMNAVCKAFSIDQYTLIRLILSGEEHDGWDFDFHSSVSDEDMERIIAAHCSKRGGKAVSEGKHEPKRGDW